MRVFRKVRCIVCAVLALALAAMMASGARAAEKEKIRISTAKATVKFKSDNIQVEAYLVPEWFDGELQAMYDVAREENWFADETSKNLLAQMIEDEVAQGSSRLLLVVNVVYIGKTEPPGIYSFPKPPELGGVVVVGASPAEQKRAQEEQIKKATEKYYKSLEKWQEDYGSSSNKYQDWLDDLNTAKAKAAQIVELLSAATNELTNKITGHKAARRDKMDVAALDRYPVFPKDEISRLGGEGNADWLESLPWNRPRNAQPEDYGPIDLQWNADKGRYDLHFSKESTVLATQLLFFDVIDDKGALLLDGDGNKAVDVSLQIQQPVEATDAQRALASLLAFTFSVKSAPSQLPKPVLELRTSALKRLLDAAMAVKSDDPEESASALRSRLRYGQLLSR